MIINEKKPIYKAYFGDTQIITNVGSEGTGGGGESTTEGFDFSVLGYDTTLNNTCNDKIQTDIDYSTTILNNWYPYISNAYGKFKDNSKLVYLPLINTSQVTDMEEMFKNASSLIIIPEIDTSKVTKMKNTFDGCGSLTAIPLLDTSSCTNMQYMFYNCASLSSIPLLNTSNVTIMYSMFYGCKSLQSIPQLDTSSCTDMGYMFALCKSLSSIPLLNTSNVTSMSNMFNDCDSLETIPQLDTSNVKAASNMFYTCDKLKSIPLLDFSSITTITSEFAYLSRELTDVGGFANLGKSFSGSSSYYATIGFSSSSKLTRESVLNIFNNLYDMTLRSDYTVVPKISLHSTPKNLLSDEDIAIATNKGWTIS